MYLARCFFHTNKGASTSPLFLCNNEVKKSRKSANRNHDKKSVFFGKDLTDFDNIILPDDVKYLGKNVQYAKRQHFAKQDLSTITRASYIHHAWATNELTGCLTPSEISEFNRVIGQMKAGTYDPIPLNDGRYLIEVGEYMNGDRVTYILTDGVWQGQSIEWVGKIVTNSIRLTKTIKEYVNELSKTLGCEAVALALDAYAAVGVDEGFQEFTLERAVSYEEFDKQRAARQDNIGNTKIQYSRKRNVGEIESNGIKPSRKLNSELARVWRKDV